jgi:PH (Pleckstrin Homology) domain-containing protein
MDAAMGALTLFVLALPVVLFVGGMRVRPSPAGSLLLGCAGVVLALYAYIWLWMRPTGFDLEPAVLRIVWPARQRDIPRSDILSARILDRRALRDEIGWGGRIGAGGLGGGFGMLWSSKRGLLDMYVSRIDTFVLVERRRGRPLLITPAEPERFVLEIARG